MSDDSMNGGGGGVKRGRMGRWGASLPSVLTQMQRRRRRLGGNGEMLTTEGGRTEDKTEDYGVIWGSKSQSAATTSRTTR